MGGFALAVVYQPADAYQSPSSAAAQRGIQSNGQTQGLVAGTASPSLSPMNNGASNNGTSMNEAFIMSNTRGFSANVGLDARTGMTNITLSNLNIKVNRPMLEMMYRAVFNRDLDSGAMTHIGKSLPVVIHDIMNSHEARHYGALMAAVKAYENAQRQPGTLSEADRQTHMARINDALNSLIAWVDSLPAEGSETSPSLTPALTASPSPSPTATASPSPTVTVSPTASPTASPSPTP